MSLKLDIDSYLKNSLLVLEDMREYYYNTQSLKESIINASIGNTPSGKMDSHQWRVGRVNGTRGADMLLLRIAEIKKSKSFGDIFKITEEVRKEIYGLGDLWSYDTALRIGFKMELYPTEVYIQRGVIKGVKKILPQIKRTERSLPLSIFSNDLQKLKPYQAENFLCILGKSKKK
jgi:hypothetical protein